MNQQKFDQLYRGLTIQAKKVYDVIPIAEAWSITQIMQELHRLNISMSDKRVVTGCLNSLVACGLATEPSKFMFKRTDVRATPIAEVKETKEPEVNNPSPTKTAEVINIKPVETQADPMALLSKVVGDLVAIASSVEAIITAIARRDEKKDAESEKLRQLQSLLKSMV